MELNQQARDGLDCREWMSEELARLQAGKRGDPHIRRFWIHARGLLTACASASLIFWPSPAGKRDLAELREYRAKALREEYGMTDASPLANRELRDHFTHYDERLDAWAADAERTGFADGNIGPLEALPYREDCVLRHYDDQRDQFVFLGTRYDVAAMVGELRQIADHPVAYATMVRERP